MSRDYEQPEELQTRTKPDPFLRYPYELHFRLPQFKTLAEMKVVLYVLRHTFGFKEWGQMKRITIDEFQFGRKRHDGTRMDNGTGLSYKAVVAGVQQAVADHFLYEFVDDSDLARIRKYYAVALWETDEPDISSGNIPEEDEADIDEPDIPSGNTGPAQREYPDVPKGNSSPSQREYRSEIETPDTDLKINTNKIETLAPAARSPIGSPLIDIKQEEERKDAETPAPERMTTRAAQPSQPAIPPETAEQARQREAEETARRLAAEEASRRHAERLAELERLKGEIDEKERAYNQMVMEEMRLRGLIKKATDGEKAAREAAHAAYWETMALPRQELEALKRARHALMQG